MLLDAPLAIFLPLLVTLISLSHGTLAFSLSRPQYTPQALPEDVVAQQLRLFKQCNSNNGDENSEYIRSAYKDFMSSDAKMVTENSWKLFREALYDDECFLPILGHQSSSVLMVVYGEEDDLKIQNSACLVKIVPSTCGQEDGDDVDSKFSKTLPKYYWWEVSKDEMSGRWLVDSVTPDFDSMELEEYIEEIDDEDFDDFDFF